METKVAFRVDASNQIGAGHFMRCLTLADGLNGLGVRIRFVCRHLPAHLQEVLLKRGYEITMLSGHSGKPAGGSAACKNWLGVSQMEDARSCKQALSDQLWDWLVVDNYALDERWETEQRGNVSAIMAIDDLADRQHDCDLLLDQNLAPHMQSRYAGKTGEGCHMLLGPQYALLQPIYARLHGKIRPRTGPVKRVFVFFGGADSDNLTGRAIAAFLSLDRTDIDLDAVVAVDSPHAASIREQAAAHANIHLHSGLQSLAPLMAEADLAIGAAGATSWERLCLGLPALVAILADNQQPIAFELDRQGLAIAMGPKKEVSSDLIRQRLEPIIKDGLGKEWSNIRETVVDGRGTERVVSAMNKFTFLKCAASK